MDEARCVDCSVRLVRDPRNDPVAGDDDGDGLRCHRCARADVTRCCKCGKRALDYEAADRQFYCARCIPPQPMAAPPGYRTRPNSAISFGGRSGRRGRSRSAKSRASQSSKSRASSAATRMRADQRPYCVGCHKLARAKPADDGLHYCRACFNDRLRPDDMSLAPSEGARSARSARSGRSGRSAAAMPPSSLRLDVLKVRKKAAVLPGALPGTSSVGGGGGAGPSGSRTFFSVGLATGPGGVVGPACARCRQLARQRPYPDGLHYCRACFKSSREPSSNRHSAGGPRPQSALAAGLRTVASSARSVAIADFSREEFPATSPSAGTSSATSSDAGAPGRLRKAFCSLCDRTARPMPASDGQHYCRKCYRVIFGTRQQHGPANGLSGSGGGGAGEPAAVDEITLRMVRAELMQIASRLTKLAGALAPDPQHHQLRHR